MRFHDGLLVRAITIAIHHTYGTILSSAEDRLVEAVDGTNVHSNIETFSSFHAGGGPSFDATISCTSVEAVLLPTDGLNSAFFFVALESFLSSAVLPHEDLTILESRVHAAIGVPSGDKMSSEGVSVGETLVLLLCCVVPEGNVAFANRCEGVISGLHGVSNIVNDVLITFFLVQLTTSFTVKHMDIMVS